MIRALNADLPYDQFVIEHVAGDLLEKPRLHPAERFNESIIGTGFWFLGEWCHSPVDIRKDECDRIDNMLDVFSKTFLGVTVAEAPAKPKVVAKPQPQKSYSLLSEVQISGIRDRLKLSSSQEYYWPSVESALRNVVRKISANKLSNPNAQGVPIDPNCDEVQQLKSAAMPLLFQLREDQKREVRSLARIIGLEKVASMI